MRPDCRGQGRHFFHKTVSPGHLERDQADVPRGTGSRERALNPSHMQNVNLGSPEGQGPADGNGMHQTAVQEMLIANPHRRQQARDRARGQHGIGQAAGGEPVRRRALDAGRHALELDRTRNDVQAVRERVRDEQLELDRQILDQGRQLVGQ